MPSNQEISENGPQKYTRYTGYADDVNRFGDAAHGML